MAMHPRIIASNGPLIEKRRKADHLKWRDAIWIVPAMALGVGVCILKEFSPLAYAFAGWCIAIFFLAGLITILNAMRRERRVWPHRYSRFGYVPITYFIVFLTFSVVGGAIALIRHLVR